MTWPFTLLFRLFFLAAAQALERAEAKKWLPVDALFEDVYDQIPQHLQEQVSSFFLFFFSRSLKMSMTRSPSICKNRSLSFLIFSIVFSNPMLIFRLFWIVLQVCFTFKVRTGLALGPRRKQKKTPSESPCLLALAPSPLSRHVRICAPKYKYLRARTTTQMQNHHTNARPSHKCKIITDTSQRVQQHKHNNTNTNTNTNTNNNTDTSQRV